MKPKSLGKIACMIGVRPAPPTPQMVPPLFRVAVVVVTVSSPPCRVAVVVVTVSSPPCRVAVVVVMVSSPPWCGCGGGNGFIHPLVWLWWW